ncbi:acyl-CoA carboxylase subunit beta [Thermodesulfobacteriota bacterium]
MNTGDEFEKIVTRKTGMGWEAAIDEMQKRREAARKMGGKERVDRQHSFNKLTVRERIEKLADKGTFFEAGSLMGNSKYDDHGDIVDFTPSAFVTGLAEIDGRSVTVGGEDFTVSGGSPGGVRKQRSFFAQPMSIQYGVPMIQLCDGAGARGDTIAQKRKTEMENAAKWRWWNVEVMNKVPVVSAILGSAAGHVAGDAMFSHFSVMVKGSGQIFPGGPPVVERAYGYPITKEELGGTWLHCRDTGVIDNEAVDEADCFRQVRQFLSYMPDNINELPPHKDMGDDPNRREEKLLNIVPIERLKNYNMYDVIRLIVDKGEYFEMRKYYGAGVITAFARMDGFVVGILASNPMVEAGAIGAKSALKMARFIDLCNFFNIPLILLADTPGFNIGIDSEKEGTVRCGVHAIMSAQEAGVPKVHIGVRKAYGMGATAFNSLGGMLNLQLRLGWPTGEWGAIPIEGGVAATFRRDIASSEDPEKRRKEIEARLVALRSPLRAAEQGGIMDIIDPRDTRPIVCKFIRLAQPALKRHAAGPKRTVRPI